MVLGAILVGTAAGVAHALHDFSDQRRTIIDVLQPAIGDSREALAALLGQAAGERGFVLTGNEEFLVSYVVGGAEFTAVVARLRDDFADDAEVTAQLDQVVASAEVWRSLGPAPEILAVRAGDLDRARQLVADGQGKDAFDDLRDDVKGLEMLVDARRASAQDRADAALRTVETTLVVSVALLLALVVVAGLLLRRWVLVPVESLRSGMRAVASGHLDRRVTVQGPPEVVAISEDAEAMRRRIVSELDAARSATEALSQHSPVVVGLRRELEDDNDGELPGLVVHGEVHAAQGVLAGDWWESVQRPDGTVCVVVADVSGHGAEACLVAARFKSRLTVLLRSDLDLGTAFGLAAHDLDDDAERFVSCALVEVTPGEPRLRWINAGHPGAVVVGARNGRSHSRSLEPTGPVIGAGYDGWLVETTALSTDDLVLLVTDGVTEARDPDRGELGIAGVLGTLGHAGSWQPRDAVDAVVEAVRSHAHDWRRDDVTCVALRLATPVRADTRVPVQTGG